LKGYIVFKCVKDVTLLKNYVKFLLLKASNFVSIKFITKMNLKGIGSIEGLPIIKLAALMIIFAGVIYAKSIIAPFLHALFISIILEQNEKTLWLAILLGTPDEAKAYLQNKELYHKTT